MGETFARTFARHFNQTQLGKAVDGHARTITRQRLAKLVEHRVLVLLVIHVDEIDNDDAAEITQPQLAGRHQCRLKVGFENRVVEIATTDKTAGIDINGGQRLGLIDNQIAAGFQINAACQRFLNLILHTIEVE